MGIWRVVRHAPGRPDYPSPILLRRAPRKPPPRSPLGMKSMSGAQIDKRVALLFLFVFLELRDLSLFNKVNVSALRRDLGRIKVSLSAWDRAHKDNIRAKRPPVKRLTAYCDLNQYQSKLQGRKSATTRQQEKREKKDCHEVDYAHRVQSGWIRLGLQGLQGDGLQPENLTDRLL
eukprot:1146286-Pelagomonas_calceolata.AAC.2